MIKTKDVSDIVENYSTTSSLKKLQKETIINTKFQTNHLVKFLHCVEWWLHLNIFKSSEEQNTRNSVSFKRKEKQKTQK